MIADREQYFANRLALFLGHPKLLKASYNQPVCVS